MQIPESLFERWKALRSAGDVDKIAEKSGYSIQSVYNVFYAGVCSDNLFAVMAEYFKAKEDLVNQYINKA